MRLILAPCLWLCAAVLLLLLLQVVERKLTLIGVQVVAPSGKCLKEYALVNDVGVCVRFASRSGFFIRCKIFTVNGVATRQLVS